MFDFLKELFIGKIDLVQAEEKPQGGLSAVVENPLSAEKADLRVTRPVASSRQRMSPPPPAA